MTRERVLRRVLRTPERELHGAVLAAGERSPDMHEHARASEPRPASARG